MKNKLRPGIDPGKLSPLGKRVIQGLREAVAHARGEISLPVRHVYIPDRLDVKAVRKKTRLSQSEFAGRYGFRTQTLQEWEHGRSQPDSAVRAYLLVIERNRRAVEEALRGRAGEEPASAS